MVSVSLLAGPQQEGQLVFLQSSFKSGLEPLIEVESSLGNFTGKSSALGNKNEQLRKKHYKSKEKCLITRMLGRYAALTLGPACG